MTISRDLRVETGVGLLLRSEPYKNTAVGGSLVVKLLKEDQYVSGFVSGVFLNFGLYAKPETAQCTGQNTSGYGTCSASAESIKGMTGDIGFFYGIKLSKWFDVRFPVCLKIDWTKRQIDDQPDEAETKYLFAGGLYLHVRAGPIRLGTGLMADHRGTIWTNPFTLSAAF